MNDSEEEGQDREVNDGAKAVIAPFLFDGVECCEGPSFTSGKSSERDKKKEAKKGARDSSRVHDRAALEAAEFENAEQSAARVAKAVNVEETLRGLDKRKDEIVARSKQRRVEV